MNKWSIRHSRLSTRSWAGDNFFGEKEAIPRRNRLNMETKRESFDDMDSDIGDMDYPMDF